MVKFFLEMRITIISRIEGVGNYRSLIFFQPVQFWPFTYAYLYFIYHFPLAMVSYLTKHCHKHPRQPSWNPIITRAQTTTLTANANHTHTAADERCTHTCTHTHTRLLLASTPPSTSTTSSGSSMPWLLSTSPFSFLAWAHSNSLSWWDYHRLSFGSSLSILF
jgi:hypothetical protein